MADDNVGRTTTDDVKNADQPPPETEIDFNKLESSPTSYWGARLRLFLKENPEEGMALVQESMKEDAAAWSIFAALLMTVGFAGLTISRQDFEDDHSEFQVALYVFGNTASLVTSFLAVVAGTFRYLIYNNLPAHLMDIAIARYRIASFLPALLTQISIVFQFVGATQGCWLLFDNTAGWVALITVIVGTLSFGLLWLQQTRTYSALELTAGFVKIK